MNTCERHQHLRLLEQCARITTDSMPCEVKDAFLKLVYASIPGANVRECYGFTQDPCHILSINMPEYKSNWVIIIKRQNIMKYGRDCLMAYHLRLGINFDKVYSSDFKTSLFSDAYEILCDRSKDLLYRYDIHLSCEALVHQMLVHMNN